MTNAHETLGVDPSATIDEIKAAYREAARKHHPDRGGNAEQFKAITEAFEFLTGKTDGRSELTQRVEHAILEVLEGAFQQNRKHPIRFILEHYDEQRDNARNTKKRVAEIGQSYAKKLEKFKAENAGSKNTQAKQLIEDFLESKVVRSAQDVLSIDEDIKLFDAVLEYLNDINTKSDVEKTRSQFRWPEGGFALSDTFMPPPSAGGWTT